MEAQTVDTLPPVAADHDPVRCLLAIEMSKKSWIVAITTALSDKISRYTLDGCDWKGLLELMERVRARVAREVGRPVEMISCYEAGYDGFWLHRLLERQGVRSHVDRKSTRLNSSHSSISYAVFCLKKKITQRSMLTSASTHPLRRFALGHGLIAMIESQPLCQRRMRVHFFFNDTATTEIYTLSLHDALPI